MSSACRLARRGLGRTSPNPPVGAVVVGPDGTLLGRGWHRRAGEPHAEPLALGEAGESARGATLYCTLEPCCHQGRTPPCTDAIIAAGIRRVVYGLTDPDPRCAGGGAEMLRQAGLVVEQELLRGRIAEHYEPYVKHKTTGRPFVTVKLALTLDGKVATASGDSRWITGEQSRALVHGWRNESDAVLVGVGTVLADDPQLTVRPAPRDGRQPLRVIADSRAVTPPRSRVVTGPGGCLIAVSEGAPERRVRALREAGVEVIELPATGQHVSLAALMAHLGQRDVMSILCEGGPELAAGLVKARLADKYRLFYAPKLVGAEGLSGIGPLGLERMDEALAVELRQGTPRRVGNDLLVTAYPCSPG
ncbi:bifunctional diaminohydroxyphosphoribosylaminopyrimidine deaminase/5-amino-6-(5-phosphoribosylamino)uracil reductase RibD [bacterium]|nr:bifunctional diaminohydroxyphosphoribosylaminopyrimidine deaminase/5-amino-6-(5-phosphoribosylamino)uracil reductase RibD [bacterium]